MAVFVTWLEGRVYLPLADWNQSTVLLEHILLYSVFALVIAGLAELFGLVAETGKIPASRDADGIVLVMLAGGVLYLICHWAFTALFYRYFTHNYYSTILELKVGVEATQRLGWRLALIEFGRGALMALAVVPAVALMRVDRVKAAIIAGSVLWIAGGLGPQMVPNTIIPQHLRWIQTWQTLLQNFPVGFVTAWIMRKTAEPAAEPQPQAASTTA